MKEDHWKSVKKTVVLSHIITSYIQWLLKSFLSSEFRLDKESYESDWLQLFWNSKIMIANRMLGNFIFS